MVIRPRPSVWTLFFIRRGSILPTILPRLLAITLLSILVVACYELRWFPWLNSFHAMPFSLLGIALSIFLGFRNSACYDRWWEARKHWGELIVMVRSNAREALALLPPEAARQTLYYSLAFTNALRAHLRDQAPHAAAEPWLNPADQQHLAQRRNLPDAILQQHHQLLAQLYQQALLSDINYRGLVQRLDQMAGIQAACERIRSTPTPFAYSLLLHRTAWLFCLLLPFGLVSTLEGLTPLLVTAVAYTYFGLDALGDELEEPFSLTDNGLPLSAMSRTLEINLLEMLGEPLPEPCQAKQFVLN